MWLAVMTFSFSLWFWCCVKLMFSLLEPFCMCFGIKGLNSNFLDCDDVGGHAFGRLTLLAMMGTNRTWLPRGLTDIFFFKSSHFSLKLEKTRNGYY